MNSSFSKQQIEAILREEPFEYHRVELPYGLFTPGVDRSATRDEIFPASLTGKSVLDVGCALGYFCFEAEIRGAARVVGIEPKDSRFRQSLRLKQIRGSGVEFRHTDLAGAGIDERFDYILLLNVVHHLRDPLAVLSDLAAITRERFVVEFPTLSDPKFKKASGVRLGAVLNRLPLIGVSSLETADQTFVFSPRAIERILREHVGRFARIELKPSPMPGRALAICDVRPPVADGARSLSEP